MKSWQSISFFLPLFFIHLNAVSYAGFGAFNLTINDFVAINNSVYLVKDIGSSAIALNYSLGNASFLSIISEGENKSVVKAVVFLKKIFLLSETRFAEVFFTPVPQASEENFSVIESNHSIPIENGTIVISRNASVSSSESNVTLGVTNPNDFVLVNVSVNESIPKEVVRNASELLRAGFSSNPNASYISDATSGVVVSFIFDSLQPRETKLVKYTINKYVPPSLFKQFNEFASAQKQEQPQEASPRASKSSLDLALIAVLIILLVAALFLFLKRVRPSY